MSSNTEELVVKVTIYIHARTIHTQTHAHYTVIQLCTRVSVSSFLSGITGDSLPVSLSHTHKQETNWGAEWDSGWCRCTIVTATTRVLFFFFFFFFRLMRLSQVIWQPKGGKLWEGRSSCNAFLFLIFCQSREERLEGLVVLTFII